MKLLLLAAAIALVTPVFAVETCPTPSRAGYSRYCHLDTYGLISLRELTDDEYNMDMSNGEPIFSPLSVYRGISYNCECEPACATEGSEYSQVGLDDTRFSYFHNDTFHYCIAIPVHSLDNHLFFQDAEGAEVPLHNCLSTANLSVGEDCYGWQKMPVGSERHYRHSCYETFCVSAPWEPLSASYASHTDEYWTQSYYGVVASTSQYARQICHEADCHYVTPLSYTAPNLFSISTTIHVTAHLDDIRVYAPAVVIAYETSHDTVFTDFEWGLDNSVGVVAQIYFTTQVQAPLFVEIESYAARSYNGSMMFSEIGDRSECMNRTYGADAAKDAPCKQRFLVTLKPEYEMCGIDTVLDLAFRFYCDPAFVTERGECPFTRAYDNLVRFEFDYATDNWCNTLDLDIPRPNAYMDSYSGSYCSAEADDFLHYERPHYEVHVEGNGYLSIASSTLNSLHVSTTCGDGYKNAAYFYLAGARTHYANDVNLAVDNTPSRVCRGSEAESVRFYFDLENDFFAPPKKAYCEFEVWAVIELEYVGFERETTLLSVELTQDRAEFGDAESMNMGSITKMGSYAFEEVVATTAPSSGASTLAASSAVLVLAAIPALL